MNSSDPHGRKQLNEVGGLLSTDSAEIVAQAKMKLDLSLGRQQGVGMGPTTNFRKEWLQGIEWTFDGNVRDPRLEDLAKFEAGEALHPKPVSDR